jgi:ABC-type dipeptide/oligopeptide/nickel transport system permease subunit
MIDRDDAMTACEPTQENVTVMSPARQAMRRLARNKAALGAIAIFVVLVWISLLAPWIAPYDPLDALPGASLKPPSWEHPMGTDLIGRDILSRVLYGGRISLRVGIVSVGVSASIGILVGVIAGYFGGMVDNVLMRLIDIMLAFPGILLALSIVSFLGTGLTNAMIAVGISGIPNFARLVRGSVISGRENVYVTAAESIGCSHGRIIFRHILPNVVAPVIVMASLSYGWALLNAASLSFLGLGAQPPVPEWGVMLSDGRGFLRDAPWMTIFPGLLIMLSVLATNVLGDALRDALDPRLRV